MASRTISRKTDSVIEPQLPGRVDVGLVVHGNDDSMLDVAASSTRMVEGNGLRQVVGLPRDHENWGCELV